MVLAGELVPMQRVEPLLGEFYLHPPELVLVAGTSAVFPYITEPVFFARQAGRLTVEVNADVTQLSEYVDFHLAGTPGTVLPEIAAVLERARARAATDGSAPSKKLSGTRPEDDATATDS
jgi:NAD-dependent deacetylase